MEHQGNLKLLSASPENESLGRALEAQPVPFEAAASYSAAVKRPGFYLGQNGSHNAGKSPASTTNKTRMLERFERLWAGEAAFISASARRV